MRPMKIQVTQKHINAGSRGSCNSDPVALAMKEAGYMHPWISPDRIRVDGFNGGFMREDFEMPESVEYFIREFDNGRFVEPFEFELEG